MGCPGVPGAYVFRDSTAQDVLCIGSTSRLRRRLFGNYVGGVGGATTQRIPALLLEEGRIWTVDVALHPDDDYRRREECLKGDHGRDHGGDLPPWNRR